MVEDVTISLQAIDDNVISLNIKSLNPPEYDIALDIESLNPIKSDIALDLKSLNPPESDIALDIEDSFVDDKSNKLPLIILLTIVLPTCVIFSILYNKPKRKGM